jgi:CheY-like chemotaxis protein
MILIVDDHDDIRWALRRLFTFSGIETLTAGSGAEAVAMVRQHMPELVLLDVMMPDMDGLEVLRQIRANADTKSIPVLLHTAGVHPRTDDEALRLGADGLVRKGYNDIDSLVSRIETMRNSRHVD